jgi:hypothetical protein
MTIYFEIDDSLEYSHFATRLSSRPERSEVEGPAVKSLIFSGPKQAT